MKFTLATVLGLALLGAINCGDLDDFKVGPQTFRKMDECNAFVAALLEDVIQNKTESKLDPMDMEDRSYKFKLPMNPIEAKLYKGWLSGLSSIHLTSDCDIRISKEAHLVKVEMELDPLLFKSEASLQLLLKKHEVTFYGRIERAALQLVLSIDMETEAPEVVKFAVTHTSGVELETNASKLADIFIRQAAKALKPLWTKNILTTIEDKLAKVFEGSLRQKFGPKKSGGDDPDLEELLKLLEADKGRKPTDEELQMWFDILDLL